MRSRYGRRVHHQGIWMLEGIGNQIDIILKMYRYTFLHQAIGDGGRCSVISSNLLAHKFEIARQGRHTYASDTNKINAMYIFQIHFNNFSISSTICSVALGMAIFLMFFPNFSRTSSESITFVKFFSKAASSSLSRNIMAASLATKAFAFWV